MNIKNLIKGEILQNDLLNYYNASIIYEELPYRVNGFVFNYDGVNFIIINNNISFYKKKKTFLHELAHIELNQLNQADSDLFAFNIDKYEDEVNEYINILLKEGL
jgi:Zn-dependent peptidase ImmA (M78 family)